LLAHELFVAKLDLMGELVSVSLRELLGCLRVLSLSLERVEEDLDGLIESVDSSHLW